MAHTKVTKTYSQNTGAANTFSYSGSFDVFKGTEVQVELDNIALTFTASTINESASPREYTVDTSAKTIHIGGADLSSGTIIIRPVTDMGAPTPRADYAPGSSITSADLNNNQLQLMRKAMEYDEQKLSSLGGTMTGHLTMGEDQTIIFEGATDDAYETTLTVTDPTADRTITFPNVTGTVVTTGDTATVTATMLAANSVDSSELVDASIDTSHIGNLQVTTDKIAADAVTGAKIADDAINSEHYTDGSIDTVHIADSQVTTAKLADTAVTTAKITDGNVTTAKIAADAITAAKIADDVVNSEHYAAGSIDTEHYADNSITTAKLVADCVIGSRIADDAIDSEHYTDGSIDTAHIGDNQVTTAKIPDDAITNAKIADDAIDSAQLGTGVIDAEHLSSSAVTNAKIGAGAVDSSKIATGGVATGNLASGAVTTGVIANDAVTGDKLADNIDIAGTLDVTGNAVFDANVNIKADNKAFTVENASGTDKFTIDTDNGNTVIKGTLDVEGDTNLAASSIGTAALASNAVTTAKITDGNVTTVKVADSNITLAKLASDLKQTSISDSDTQIPTSGAVVDYVAAQIAPIGGLEVIADDESFPNTIPSAGVVISISDAAGLQVNSSGVSTNGDALDNSTITINGFPSELRGGVGSNADPYVLGAGTGLMVQSTGSSHTYNYHQVMIRESDFVQLSDDINDFNSRYRINAGEPSSNNDDGDLCWDTNADKMKVYDGTASAWKEVTSSGDFKYLVMTNAGTTNAATLNGSNVTFDLKETSTSGSAASVTSAAQLLVSVNGVVQKANTGTSASGLDGFVMADADTITFCAAPASGDDIFIVQIGSAITISTPGDGTVVAAKIGSGAVTTAKIADANVTTAKIADANVTTAKLASDAVTGAKIADDAVGAEHIEDLDATVKWVDSAKAIFGTGNDLEIYHDGSTSMIKDAGTGNLNFQASHFDFINAAGNEYSARLYNDGAVELYHNNVEVFKTQTNGIFVKGPEGGDATLYLYADEGDDNADQWGLLASTGGDFSIRNYAGGGWETNIKCTGNGNVELYYDNSKKLETTSDGITMTGWIYIPDSDGSNNMMRFGAGADLKIYHDGSNSHIHQDGTGDLQIRSDNSIEFNTNGTENAIWCDTNGAVKLYYDGGKKFETVSGGAKVVDTFIIRGDEGNNATLEFVADEGDDAADNWRITGSPSASQLAFQNYADSAWENSFILEGSGAAKVYYNNSLKLETTNDGVTLSGDINIGSNTFFCNDNGKLRIGGGQDFEIYHNGTANYVLGKGSHDLILGTADSPVLFLQDNGADVTFGTSVTNGGAQDGRYVFEADGSSKSCIKLRDTDTGNGGNNGIVFVRASSQIGSVETQPSATVYNTSSDYRLKENAVTLANGITRLKTLKPYNFNFKIEPDKTVDGFFAHEVQSVVPGAVSGTKDQVDSDNKIIPQGIDHSKLVPLLTAALQEAITKIETLETKVAALEAG